MAATADALDQFYTDPVIAGRYVQGLMKSYPDPEVFFIEPAAGAGAFVKPLRRAGRAVWAMDIEPAAAGIRCGDFLDGRLLLEGRRADAKVVVLGNPPFGRNASMAVRFFNAAARHGDVIAFIVPRTFRKISLQNRLNKHFHMIHDSDVERGAFLLNGRKHDVPCAWQIWERRSGIRTQPEPPSVSHLIDYTGRDAADFAVRRVGFYAGRVVTSRIGECSLTTHYFMREMQKGVIEAMRSADWSNIAGQTAGVRSLSKKEIAFKLNELCGA